MNMPEFSHALARAETNVLSIIGRITQPVVSSLPIIGTTPPRHGTAAVRMTVPRIDDQAFWTTLSCPILAWGAVAVGAFRQREDAQCFVMLMAGVLPLHLAKDAAIPLAGQLSMMRISGIGEVQQTMFNDENEPRPWAWTVAISMDVVFFTGSRDTPFSLNLAED